MEINAEDWYFTDTQGRYLFGNQEKDPQDLFLVLLHETGHWLGLRHSNKKGDIMYHGIDSQSCVGADTMDELSRASDLGFQGRLGGFGALKSPHTK